MTNRRHFIQSIAAAGISSLAAAKHSEGAAVDKNSSPQALTFGLITDLHYADKDTWATRHYRDSLKKLSRAVEAFNDNGAAFAVELGDIIDSAEKEIEYGYLRSIDSIFDSFNGQRHYVMGNHDVATFTKVEFMKATGSPRNYYSFDLEGWHFVILDACYRGDGTPYNAGNFKWTDSIIPEPELAWLSRDIEDRPEGSKVILFTHQNLHNEDDDHGVKNAPDVRKVLEESGAVRAVFQGHMHTGGYAEISGIHYLTLRAGVEGPGTENNSFALVSVDDSGNITVTGKGNQESYSF